MISGSSKVRCGEATSPYGAILLRDDCRLWSRRIDIRRIREDGEPASAADTRAAATAGRRDLEWPRQGGHRRQRVRGRPDEWLDRPDDRGVKAIGDGMRRDDLDAGQPGRCQTRLVLRERQGAGDAAGEA